MLTNATSLVNMIQSIVHIIKINQESFMNMIQSIVPKHQSRVIYKHDSVNS